MPFLEGVKAFMSRTRIQGLQKLPESGGGIGRYSPTDYIPLPLII